MFACDPTQQYQASDEVTGADQSDRTGKPPYLLLLDDIYEHAKDNCATRAI